VHCIICIAIIVINQRGFKKTICSLLCGLILGAYFLINYNPNNFTIEQFSKEFEKDMPKLKPTFEKHQLSYYMSKLLNGKVQVVMASNTKYVDEINEIAKTVHSLLITCK